MNEFLEEYSKEAMTTAIYPNVGNNLSYPAKAVVDEWGEIAEMILGKTPPFTPKQLVHEFGDGFWEVNALIVEMGYSFSALVIEAADMYVVRASAGELVVDAYLMISKIMGRLKKYERDGDAKQLVLARDYTVQFLALFGALLQEYGLGLEDVLQINLDKLSDRAERNVLGGDGDER